MKAWLVNVTPEKRIRVEAKFWTLTKGVEYPPCTLLFYNDADKAAEEP